MLSLITSLGSSEIHGVSTVRYIEFCFLRLAGNQIFVFTSNSACKKVWRHRFHKCHPFPHLFRAGHDPLIWIKYIPGPA